MNYNQLTTISKKITSGKLLDVSSDDLALLEQAATILSVYKDNMKLFIKNQTGGEGSVNAGERVWKLSERVTYKAANIDKVTDTFVAVKKTIDTKAVKAFYELNGRLPAHVDEVKSEVLTCKPL